MTHALARANSGLADRARGLDLEAEVWGVEALGERHHDPARARPSEQYRVSRELRQRLKAAFEREGIEIPFPQQTVWHRTVETR